MMRTSRWTLCVVLFCFLAVVMAQKQKLMADPLFGISYDQYRVHFERMPSLLEKKCTWLHGRYVAAWAYGHFKSVDSEYFLISGLMESQEDEPRGARTIAPDEGGGLVVALQGSKCLVDQSEYFLTQGTNPAKKATPIMVPREVLIGIVQDAFKKYAIAFGGKQEFLKHVKPNALLPFVREQLETFEKDSGK
jgi:hypothetical protein